MVSIFQADPTFITAVGVVAGLGIGYIYRLLPWKKRCEEKVDKIMSLLQCDINCHITDSVALREKIRTIVSCGNECLQILSDFDFTLTSFHVKNKYGVAIKGHSSFQVIEESSQFSRKAAKELMALFEKYHPIEMCPTMSTDEKIPLMIEWYSAASQVRLKGGIKQSLLPSMVKETYVTLRSGMRDFFQNLKRFNIPLLITSAGFGDVINEVFEQQAKLPPQVTILANYYDYNEDGVAVELKNDVLFHSYNKDMTGKINKTYFDGHRKRTNALVMGDTLGDPLLSNGIDYLKCILKVGFLNSNIKASLQKYQSAYDVVLTGDPSMEILTVLLKELFSQ